MNTVMLGKEKVHKGALVLVNERYPLLDGNRMGLSPVDERFSGILMKRDAVNVLRLILEKISAIGRIVPVSGYRTSEEQRGIYENSLRENGGEFTRKFVALPDHSEHQTGLAIDLALNTPDIDFICPEFPYYGICGDFRKAAPDYGYIERYPAGKEKITGIAHEPWHFRYVGFPHSAVIAQKGFALEEYIEFIKAYNSENRFVFEREGKPPMEIFYVPAVSGTTRVSMPGRCIYQVSGNNADGFIVTVWRKENE